MVERWSKETAKSYTEICNGKIKELTNKNSLNDFSRDDQTAIIRSYVNGLIDNFKQIADTMQAEKDAVGQSMSILELQSKNDTDDWDNNYQKLIDTGQLQAKQ